MTYLWARTIRKHKITQSETIEMESGLQDALAELLLKMDIPRPLFLSKHEREWEQFQQTSFGRDHFVETVPFDKLEIEMFDTDAKKRKSDDPRNG